MRSMGMNTGIKTTTVLTFLVLALAGCGSSPERTDYKDAAGKGRSLEVPPDLVVPKSDTKYSVPEGSTEKSATYSEYARATANQGQCTCPGTTASQPATAPAKAAPDAPVAAIPPKMQDKPDGSRSLLIAQPFDRCWERVGAAVDFAHIEVEDKDRSKGLLYLKSGTQLSIQGKGDRCEVSAASASGAATDDSKGVIDAVYKSLIDMGNRSQSLNKGQGR